MTVNDIYTTLDSYGVTYDGVQVDSSYHEQVSNEDVTLAELASKGGRISRVRWIGGDYIPGRGKCYDISYVHATLRDGRIVRVNLQGFDNWNLVPKFQRKGVLIEWAKNEGVYAKGLGLLEESNWSTLG